MTIISTKIKATQTIQFLFDSLKNWTVGQEFLFEKLSIRRLVTVELHNGSGFSILVKFNEVGEDGAVSFVEIL